MVAGAYEVRPDAVRAVHQEVANLVSQAAGVVTELASTVLADTSFAAIGSPVAGANKAMQAKQLATLRQTMQLLEQINQLVKTSSDQYQGADEAVATGFGGTEQTQDGSSLNNVQLGTDWGGSKSIFDQFVTPHMQDQGLATGSEKRNYDTVRGAGMSDHYVRSTQSYAVDYPTFNGEAAARSLATAMGNPNWQPNSYDSFTTTVGGQEYRVQVLWGSGIDHGDHVHVGIRRQ